jgi:hypothetical protein
MMILSKGKLLVPRFNLSWDAYHLDLCFLNVFTKLQKATVAMSHLPVRLSVHMERLGCHWMGFYEILFLRISGTSRKFKFD